MSKSEFLSSARKRAENLETMYENRADTHYKLSRLSLATSYVCYLAGAITVASEPLSVRSAATSAVLVGGGVVLGKLKKELRFSEKSTRLQADCEQGFVDKLEGQLTETPHNPEEKTIKE